MSDPIPLPLIDRLRTALMAARRGRDSAAVSALRSTIAAVENAQAVDAPAPPRPGDSAIAGSRVGLGAGEAPRRTLSEGDQLAIVGTELDDLRQSADSYQRLGRDDEADALRHGADAVEAAVGAGGAVNPDGVDR